MPAMEPLSSLLGIDSRKLSKEENFLLEAELFMLVCTTLKENFLKQQKDYFRSINLPVGMENIMIEANYARLIILDILATDNYTITGIANYTDTPEDVISDIYGGFNKNPSAMFLQKLIQLHRTVRYDLYKEIIKKIICGYMCLYNEGEKKTA